MAEKKKAPKPLHLAKLHVHKGDTVVVLSGEDRGIEGKVLRTLPREGKVLVEGVNVQKRHMRRGRAGVQSGIIDKTLPIHAAKVMVKCTECGKPTRIAHDRAPIGQDQKMRTRRICKKCGKPIQENTRS
jgi:large subunit ribosomal protein L24